MVQQYDRHHGFGDRGRANANAGVVSSGGDHLGWVSVDVNGITGNLNTAGGLKRQASHYGLA